MFTALETRERVMTSSCLRHAVQAVDRTAAGHVSPDTEKYGQREARGDLNLTTMTPQCAKSTEVFEI